MTGMTSTIRIAILNTDEPVAAVRPRHRSYGSMFQSLLDAAAKRVSPTLTVESEEFDAVKAEYPGDLSSFDALLVTGSAASSYDDTPWVRRLDGWLGHVFRTHDGLRMFGSCFGHQIICQSLLRDHGVFVEKHPGGYELGVHEMTLSDDFVNALGPPPCRSADESSGRPATPPGTSETAAARAAAAEQAPPASLRLQFIHADHVNLGPRGSLPGSWVNIGSTAHCRVQGVYLPGRVLTYQGHFEFDSFVNTETAKAFGTEWDPAFLRDALDAIDADDDSDAAADMVVRFLIEGRDLEDKAEALLPTPPAEMA
ncbi:glutamine amidotransferase [Geosmithia morbida]|uniref:Glutamine amidotransferase n=1 Tax=Geosmithia morbida TaxID=1094350 RepID=A0A9P4YRF3_9HYPO|nr:glutamine amidotransferase [Geosmithia morbida]KAF4121380.1 glutamine amidotransferase [Geosmithia morbida]